MIFANEFRGYGRRALLRDVLAGVTVGAVALPLALAFGAASVDAANAAVGIAAGLITAIVSGIVTGLLGGGSFQISGPTGAMTVVLVGIAGGVYGLEGMFLACFMAGAVMLAAGLLRFGKLVQFIPRPVVTGFTSGIAVIIALGQLGNFFGVELTGGSTLEKTADFFVRALAGIDPIAAACSLAVVLIMAFFPKKWGKYVPGSLVAMVLVTAFCAIARLDVATIGAIPTSIINSVHLDPSAITPDMVKGVAGGALTIAALGMIESLLCGTCAANMKKERFDSNVELIAQGIGNMVVPFFGGVPSTAAIARTSVAIGSGGKTRLTSVFQSLFLLACMFVFAPVIGMVPYAALAGVLAVTAFRMNEWHSIGYYFKHKLWDAAAMFAITLVATVLLDLTWAILIGVGVSMLLLVVKLTRIEIESSPLDPKDGWEEPGTLAVYTSGAMFFANAKELPRHIEELGRDYDRYIFSFRGVICIDVTCVDTLGEMARGLAARGKRLAFTGVNDSVMRTLEKTGFVALVGRDSFFTSIDHALSHGEQAH